MTLKSFWRKKDYFNYITLIILILNQIRKSDYINSTCIMNYSFIIKNLYDFINIRIFKIY